MIFRYKIEIISDIEQKIRKLLVNIAVAPFVGVWVEIERSLASHGCNMSLPSWECGLKLNIELDYNVSCLSLPSWECGLKSKRWSETGRGYRSLPSWECGLK